MTPPPDPRPLYVRRATADDLDLVVGLLHNAYDWLIARGITDQWPGPFPPQAIQELIRRGEVHVASTDNVVIATFTLSYQPDPELWDDPPDNAGYIRRLAVHRDYAGHDVGGRLLDYAGRLVAASGRPWFRLDCAKHNTRLHDYYRAHGFVHLGTIDLPHRQSGALFQRPATPSDAGEDARSGAPRTDVAAAPRLRETATTASSRVEACAAPPCGRQSRVRGRSARRRRKPLAVASCGGLLPRVA